MLHWALLQHNMLWGSEESEFLLPLARAVAPAFARGMQFTPHSWLHQQKVTREEFAASFGNGLSALYASRSGGRRWLEQTPSYSTIASELACMFPTAQFLHIVRDGRQVADSMRGMWEWSMHEAAQQWLDHVSAVLQLELDQPSRVLRVHFEQLVTKPRQQLQQVFAFLGLREVVAAANFIQSSPINCAPGVTAQSSTDKLEPRWHAWSPDDLQQFDQLAGVLRLQLGYP